MKPNTVALLSLSALLVCLAGCCRPLKLSGLGVPQVPQHRDWWCWAATTEMITTYYGHSVDQCNSANFVHGTPPDCCTGCTGNCPGWGSAWGASISDIQNNWTHWKFQYTYVASSLTWDVLRKTTSTAPSCSKSPIQAVWWWTNGGGHVVTVYGYAEIGGQQYVSYLNPLPEDCATNGKQCTSQSGGGEDAVTTYADFVSNTAHSWGNSFHSFKYVGP